MVLLLNYILPCNLRKMLPERHGVRFQHAQATLRVVLGGPWAVTLSHVDNLNKIKVFPFIQVIWFDFQGFKTLVFLFLNKKNIFWETEKKLITP